MCCCCCCKRRHPQVTSATGSFTQNIPVTMSYRFTPTSIGNEFEVNAI